MNLGKKIKSLLIKRGMKQIQLCEALDISPSRLSNYLSGNREPDLEMLSKIAVFFDTSLDIFSTEKMIVDLKIMKAIAFEKKERQLSDVQVSYLTGLPVAEITEFFERPGKPQDKFVTNELITLFLNDDGDNTSQSAADNSLDDKLVVHLGSTEIVLEPTLLSIDQLKTNTMYLVTDNVLIDNRSQCESFFYGRYCYHSGTNLIISTAPAGHAVHWVLHDESMIYKVAAIIEKF